MSVSQGHKVSLTRMLIGTRGLFVSSSQDWFSEPGCWGWLIVCSYPEPVRMTGQNIGNR